MQEIEDSLLRAIEERLAAQKPKWWLALLPAIISAMLAAIIIPWGSWVTRSIADLRAQDGVFSEWRDNVPSVLKTHRLETLVGRTLDLPPDAPSGLAATPGAGTRYINLAWTVNATNATAQYLQWSRNGVEWKALATFSAGVRSYRHSGLVVGTTNWYRLRA